MSRIAKPGIEYFSFDSDTVTHRKIKLLFAEFDSHGYWIWNCLLCRIYNDKGYYYDISDREELVLFASDVCKKQVSLVDEVIKGCIRRGLFDQTVFDMYGVLTSDRIQSNYLAATKERRKKGIATELIEEYLLVNIEEKDKNIIIKGMNAIHHGKKAHSSPEESAFLPGRMPQSKVKESKEKKIPPLPPLAENPGAENTEASSVGIGSKISQTRVGKNPDLIDELIQHFQSEYLTARGRRYEILTRGKERAAVGRLVNNWKARPENAEKNTEQCRAELMEFLTGCINTTDKWLRENVSPAMILNQYNRYAAEIEEKTNASTNKRAWNVPEWLAPPPPEGFDFSKKSPRGVPDWLVGVQ